MASTTIREYLHPDRRDLGVAFLQKALRLLAKDWTDPDIVAAFVYLANEYSTPNIDLVVQEVFESDKLYVGSEYADDYRMQIGLVEHRHAWDGAAAEAAEITGRGVKVADPEDDCPF